MITGREALIEEFLRVLHRSQDVFLRRHEAQRLEVRGVQESHMRVRLDQPRHQRCAATVDHPRAFRGNRRSLRATALTRLPSTMTWPT